MNNDHTSDELHDKVSKALQPLYEELQKETGWKCQAVGGDCKPDALLRDVVINIWEKDGRDPNGQAANMTESLKDYERITVYLSVPTSVFGTWSKAAVQNWGKDRVHVAAEKPFGTSRDNADKLHQDIIGAGVKPDNLHLVDHWLSFFMVRQLPTFRPVVEKVLGIEFGKMAFKKVVVTEYEERGLDGRGGFFDGVGQVRDMVQSHLLQVFSLALIDPDSANNASSRVAAKSAIFKTARIIDGSFGQYDGFLKEPKLSYHEAFADSTLCKLDIGVDMPSWDGVSMVIQTGKDMGELAYTIDFYQADGNGTLTYEIGKEETGMAGIKVTNWPVKNTDKFEKPLPGFGEQRTKQISGPAVVNGSGYILKYDDPGMYFPKPYAVMVADLLKADYTAAFVTYPECELCWNIITGKSASLFMDPVPQKVPVYSPPRSCKQTPPNVCWSKDTVEDLYTKTYNCSKDNDQKYANIDFYQAKCHPKPSPKLDVMLLI